MRPIVASVLTLAFASAATTPARAQAPRAYSYDFRLEEGGAKRSDVTVGTVRVSGNRARVDVQSHQDDPEYFLLADGGRTVYVVHPDRRTAERHDGDSFANVVGRALGAARPVVSFTMKDFSIDTTHAVDGGMVAGRHTQRAELHEQWRMEMRALGMVRENMSGGSTATFWADPTLALMPNPLYDIVTSAMYAMAGSDRTFSAASLAARRTLARGGLLRADVTYDHGEGDRERLHYEVTRITPGAVDEQLLALPRNYRVELASTSKIKM